MSLNVSVALCAAAILGAPATKTIDQIAAGMARLDEQFDVNKHSYTIEYEKRGRYFGIEGRKAPRTVVNRTVHTRKGQKFSLYFRNTDDAEGTAKDDEAWFVWDGKICARKYGTTLDYYSYLNPVTLNYFEYLRLIDVDTYRHVDAPYSADSPTASSEVFSANQFDAQPRMLRENRPHYRLRTELEDVDGQPCHVLDWPGYDTIWIDAAHSFIPSSGSTGSGGCSARSGTTRTSSSSRTACGSRPARRPRPSSSRPPSRASSSRARWPMTRR